MPIVYKSAKAQQVALLPRSAGSASTSQPHHISTSQPHPRNASASSILLNRARFISSVFTNLSGISYDGHRNYYTTLGYPRFLDITYYRDAYQRGGIMKRIIDFWPDRLWGSGFAVIEDEDPKVLTPFELAVSDLFTRIDLTSRLIRAHKLARLGHYSSLLIGTGDSDLSTEMKKVSSSSSPVLFVQPLAEDSTGQPILVKDITNHRYGLPESYPITLSDPTGTTRTFKTHWSRVIHIAEGLLENDIYGTPALEAIFNLFHDLIKVRGGGAEAAWRRADPGMHVDVDPEIDLGPEEENLIQAEVDAYINHLDRVIHTQGAKVNLLNSQVDKFGNNVDTIFDEIAGTSEIPKRVLLGSEVGELASTHDRDNISDTTAFKREYTAIPILTQIIDRFIDYGILPEPDVSKYIIAFPEEEELTESQKAIVVSTLALANANQAKADGVILTRDEIRDMIYDKPPLQSQPDQSNQPEEVTDPVTENEQVLNSRLRHLRFSSQQSSPLHLVIIGGPRYGKSSLARRYRDDDGIPTYCSDPASLVKDPESSVTYLPEGLNWSEGSQYVANNWLTMSGSWCCEGVGMVRALRKFIAQGQDVSHLTVIHLNNPVSPLTPGQASMSKAISTIWTEIAHNFPDVINMSAGPTPDVPVLQVKAAIAQKPTRRKTRFAVARYTPDKKLFMRSNG